MTHITDFLEFDNHEMVSFIDQPKFGLRAVVSIHNTNLGPATGGTRLYNYASLDEAVRDALRLSRAMTYKCALAKVPFGGGKAVIMGGPEIKTSQLLRAYGRAIDKFGGNYTTGTDVGISAKDTTLMAKESKYILGQPKKGIKKLGTSEMAALGVYYSLLATAEKVTGKKDIGGLTIGIKGIGKIGLELVRLLKPHGINLIIADTAKDQLAKAQKIAQSVRVVPPAEISFEAMDIYMPCALGNEFTLENIKYLKTKAIVGGANNQLDTAAVGDALFNQGIVYAPDYVANAGGLINIVDELGKGGYNAKRVLKSVKNIANTLLDIYSKSERASIAPNRAADHLAEKAIYGNK